MGFIIYDAKVAALLAVFYMFYRLMLSRETFHRTNRIVLLGTAVASFLLSLCVITLHRTVMIDCEPVAADPLIINKVSETEAEAPAPIWHTAVVALFWLGVVATLAHSAMSMLRVHILIRKSEKHHLADGTVVAVTDRVTGPFSWMNYIVMNRRDYAEGNPAILAHERGHISAHHSWDVVLVDILTPLQWFNPAIWMLRSDLRAIHEFEADAAVLSQGVDARQYQYLLVRKAIAGSGYSVVNGFSHSTLKSRINMMLRKKSSHAGALKYLVLVPVVAAALIVNAETVTEYTYNPDAASKGVGTGIDIAMNPSQSGQPATSGAGLASTAATDTIRIEGHKGGAADGQAVSENSPRATSRTAGNDGDGQANVGSGTTRTSSSASEQPLYVIDGVVADKEAAQSLNPNQIGGIVILKGDAATSKYGEKGKNNVIEITTKQVADGVEDNAPVKGKIIKGKPKGEKIIIKCKNEPAPRFIIDGEPLPEGSKLEDFISTDNIERVDVYKGEAAVEKYGEEYKGGVLVITSKKK